MQISVLMPVCDAPRAWLDRAVASILNQSFRDFELLLLDDGSQITETRASLRFWSEADPRIRLLERKHCGLPATLNHGIANAKAPLIARQDADDWSEPRRFEAQVAFLNAHPEIGLLGTASWTHQGNGKPLWPVLLAASPADICSAFEYGNPFFHGSVMFRATLAQKLGGYREELLCAQDYDLFWRLSEAAPCASLAEPLYHYRYSGAAVSAQRAREQDLAARAVRILAATRRHHESEDVPAALRTAEARLESAAPVHRLRFLWKQADHHLLAGEFRSALGKFLELLWHYPQEWIAWAKLMRGLVFAFAPAARRVCFHLRR